MVSTPCILAHWNLWLTDVSNFSAGKPVGSVKVCGFPSMTGSLSHTSVSDRILSVLLVGTVFVEMPILYHFLPHPTRSFSGIQYPFIQMRALSGAPQPSLPTSVPLTLLPGLPHVAGHVLQFIGNTLDLSWDLPGHTRPL